MTVRIFGFWPFLADSGRARPHTLGKNPSEFVIPSRPQPCLRGKDERGICCFSIEKPAVPLTSSLLSPREILIFPFWNQVLLDDFLSPQFTMLPQYKDFVWNLPQPWSVSRLILLLATLSAACAADCIPFTQARDHIGETQCITGKVFRVKAGARGTTFFDFCEDFRVCPFTVVIFPGHLKDIGDVRQLKDHVIQIHGDLKEYDGRAEIVLEQVHQLGGAAALIPKLPKNYDVENRGHYSAGTFSLPKPRKTPAKKRQTPTLPVSIPEDPE